MIEADSVMIEENFNFVFNLILVQFLFNNILVINIIENIIVYRFTNLFTMILEHLFTVINIGYNKYRFDRLEKDVNELKHDNKEFKNRFDNLENDTKELKNDTKELKKMLELLIIQKQ